MPKVYTNKDVYAATLERMNIIFDNFDNIYFSVSGGKDSSVMLQTAMKVAREKNRKIDVLYIDLEAQYKATINHIEELMEIGKDVINRWYWIALPLSLRNAVSVIQPKWICWDKNDKEKWVRDMPTNDSVINEDNNIFPFFYRGMEFEEFIVLFAEWYIENTEGACACGVGIRSNESLNRFRTITNDKKVTFKDYHWTTQLKKGNKFLDIYNFYPLYDWETEDIWIATFRYDYIFNAIYELMYKNGLSIHQQRLCQPYGDDQRNGLDQFRALEYETWEKVLNRVHGVNFGNIYCRTSLLGNLTTEKPEHLSWEEYAVFLLESIGIYAPELRDHYYGKIRTFLNWYKKEQGLNADDIPDVEDKKMEAAKKKASWRRVARAIEKNDFWMSRLSFAQTKSDVKRMFELKKKYKNLIYGKDTDSKPLKRVAMELNKDE